MSRIAIVSLVVSPGDAVGNDALEMQRILSAGGHNVGLFSSHWLKKTAATKDVAELADFLADDPQAILVYHHSTGWSAGMDLLRRTTCRRVVRYHNVTPGRFFAGFPGDMCASANSAANNCASWRGPIAISISRLRPTIRGN